MTIRIFLLDDHEIVRRGLRELLETEPGFEVVGEAGTAAEARVRIPPLHPDVAIFDARLPDGSGIDVCRDVRSQDPSIVALVLTSYDDDTALASAILAGASGYLLKDIKGNGLVEAIKAVAAGEQLIRADEIDRVRRGLGAGQEGRPPAGPALTPGAAHPRPRRPRPHQPADRRGALPRREDGEELRHLGARQARGREPDAGGRLRGDAPARRPRATRGDPDRPEGLSPRSGPLDLLAGGRVAESGASTTPSDERSPS